MCYRDSPYKTFERGADTERKSNKSDLIKIIFFKIKTTADKMVKENVKTTYAEHKLYSLETDWGFSVEKRISKKFLKIKSRY